MLLLVEDKEFVQYIETHFCTSSIPVSFTVSEGVREGKGVAVDCGDEFSPVASTVLCQTKPTFSGSSTGHYIWLVGPNLSYELRQTIDFHYAQALPGHTHTTTTSEISTPTRLCSNIE